MDLLSAALDLLTILFSTALDAAASFYQRVLLATVGLPLKLKTLPLFKISFSGYPSTCSFFVSVVPAFGAPITALDEVDGGVETKRWDNKRTHTLSKSSASTL